MHSSLVRLAGAGVVAILAGTVAATPLSAQVAASRLIAEVAPYAGYIMFGSYLNGPLGTNVRSAAAPVGGAQVAVRLSPAIAVVGNVAYTRGDLEIGLPILGGLDVGSSQSWLYDAGVELRLPSAGRAASPIAPFMQLGAGAITTRLGSAGVETTSTNPAFNAGAGLDLALGRTLGMRLMLKDYIGRYESESVAGASLKGDVTHNVAASFGLRVSF